MRAFATLIMTTFSAAAVCTAPALANEDPDSLRTGAASGGAIVAASTLTLTLEPPPPGNVVPVDERVLEAARAATVELTSTSVDDLQIGGTGAVLDARRGLVVTNSHVVSGAGALGGAVTARTADGVEVAARVLGVAPCEDLAVLQLDEVPTGLEEFAAGAAPVVGDTVVALGYPIEDDGTRAATATVSWGPTYERVPVAEGEGAMTTGPEVSKLLPHGAVVWPGNSGGPLIDLQGDLVGINTLQGLGETAAAGFAIAVRDVERVVPDLVAGESQLDIGWGLVGTMDPLFAVYAGEDTGRYADYVADVPGVWVGMVADGRPADGKLVAGDLITAVGGQPVAAASQVCRVLEDHRGETVRVDGRYLGSAAQFGAAEGDRFWVRVRIP